MREHSPHTRHLIVAPGPIGTDVCVPDSARPSEYAAYMRKFCAYNARKTHSYSKAILEWARENRENHLPVVDLWSELAMRALTGTALAGNKPEYWYEEQELMLSAKGYAIVTRYMAGPKRRGKASLTVDGLHFGELGYGIVGPCAPDFPLRLSSS